MTENLGYCGYCDDTPLVLDEEYEKIRQECIKFGIYDESMVKCPKCGLSYHKSNPFIKTTTKDYAVEVLAESEANWKHNHPSFLARLKQLLQV